MKLRLWIVAFALWLLGASVQCAAPTVTVSPTTIKTGDVITVSVQMRGNVSGPDRTVFGALTCEYYDGNATEPTVFPTLQVPFKIWGEPGAIIRSPKWSLSGWPDTWQWMSEPVSTGYLGATVSHTATSIDLLATALPPDVTATTTFTLKVQ
jgi:hypothetical protein